MKVFRASESLQGRRSLFSVQVAYCSSDIRCAVYELRLTLTDTAASACLPVGRIIRLPRLLRLLNAQRKHRYNNHMSLTMLDKVQGGGPACQGPQVFPPKNFSSCTGPIAYFFHQGSIPSTHSQTREGKHVYKKSFF